MCIPFPVPVCISKGRVKGRLLPMIFRHRRRGPPIYCEIDICKQTSTNLAAGDCAEYNSHQIRFAVLAKGYLELAENLHQEENTRKDFCAHTHSIFIFARDYPPTSIARREPTV
ncbi:hypothetical protein PISMIDRAFT_683802 [Pisolithus microcarpus 441]|uniref:Uncharacterized protein n=1 Tax=Pisolithus microcarpus 441 TaxID=765257 RepID=A0A0C9Z8Q9_9AGAM|nr:hypothetical protein PISMIDRAFT_683802 [Pisolithus microcarpus 441]